MQFCKMDVKPFRAPIAKFTLALWLGCLQWPVTIPLALAFPFLYRRSSDRTSACCVVALFALGWIGSDLKYVFDPLVVAPKTSTWTCTRNASSTRSESQLECSNKAGQMFTAEAFDPPPLDSIFLGTLWPFRTPSWRQFKHSHGVQGTIRPTLPCFQSKESTQDTIIERDRLWTFLNAHFTGAIPGLLNALVSGNKHRLNAALKTRLTHAGLAHLMAVSGYHVGLVSFAFLMLLRHRRSGCRLLGFSGLLVTWCFIAFCGFPTSAVRAGLMITGYGLSQLARLNLSAMHLMGIAAWGMLIYNPIWARDLSMQLSFVAVYAILLGIELISTGHKWTPIAIYLVVPIAAQFGTGFIAWPTFGLFPKYFLFFNLIASPFMVMVGAALTGIVAAQFVLGWEYGVSIGSHALNVALNQVMEQLEYWHSADWTWDLRTVDPPLLGALSAGYLVGGTLVVAKRLSMGQFLRGLCALGAGLIPWMGWQLSHRIAVSYRYGVVMDATACSSVSVVTHTQDSIRLASHIAQFGANNANHVDLLSVPVSTHSAENWAIAPSASAGFGQLKSRPFAWKRLNGSTVLFNFGSDTIHLKQWNQPILFE